MFNSNIFYKILVFLRLRKKYEGTGCVPIRESLHFWDFRIFDNADFYRDNPFSRAYWAVYRFFKWNKWVKWLNLRDSYYEIKWFLQRGYRGWANCDTWSLDNYISKWMPDALRYLKAHKHGIPCGVVEPEDCDEHGNTTDEGFKRATARWDAIMDKMIAGFEADKKISDGLYEAELGPYPLDKPSGVSAEAWAKQRDEHFAKSRELDAQYQAVFEEGLALFVKHYRSLWD